MCQEMNGTKDYKNSEQPFTITHSYVHKVWLRHDTKFRDQRALGRVIFRHLIFQVFNGQI
jgi:hypothetical protein